MSLKKKDLAENKTFSKGVTMRTNLKKIAVVLLIIGIAPFLIVEQFIRLPGQFTSRLKQTYHLLRFINGLTNTNPKSKTNT